MDNLIAWLPENIPPETDTTVVHGDFRLDNAIYHPTEPRILAVLDWELSTLGDPLADFAYHCMSWHIPPGQFRGIAGLDLKELGIPSESEYVRRYCERTGRQDIDPVHWDFYMAYNLFRIAAILQGIREARRRRHRGERACAGSGRAREADGRARLANGRKDRQSKNLQGGRREFRLLAEGAGAAPAAHRLHEGAHLSERAQVGSARKSDRRWEPVPIIEELKAKARAQGLWNLWRPKSHGGTLTNLEYAPLCEIMGRVHWAPEVFNCSAPDTGNMETLLKYGSPEHIREWAEPLLEGKIRSAFLMTEPNVASSDATNIQTRIKREATINTSSTARKWWSSGAGDPRCRIYIVMGKTDPDNASRHSQQSMVLVPAGTPGIKILRHLPVFGYDDAPHGHMEIEFKDVRVPVSNVLLGEGRGFEIAQGTARARAHPPLHAARSAQAEAALEKMCRRATERVAFGRPVADQGVTRERIAEARIMIDSARFMVLNAAWKMDTVGNKVAKKEIAMIKVLAPNMACQVIDWAMQVHGGGGVSDDFGLARAYAARARCASPTVPTRCTATRSPRWRSASRPAREALEDALARRRPA